MMFLVDVDGVVADLMGTRLPNGTLMGKGGFERFFEERTNGGILLARRSTTHSIARAPELAELNRAFNLERMFTEYLSLPDVYQDYVDVIGSYDLPSPSSEFSDARDAITRLMDLGHGVVFVTAVWERAPSSYDSKRRWLAEHFPGNPMIVASSQCKHMVRGNVAIDDRYDTCKRWIQSGNVSRVILFNQPWNEAPPDTTYRYNDWDEIVRSQGGT